MRNIWWKICLLIATVVTLNAKEYRLFFGAFDATHPQRAEAAARAIHKKLQQVGLSAQIVKDEKKALLVVKSPLIKEKQAFQRAKMLAEKAGVTYFVKAYIAQSAISTKKEHTKSAAVSTNDKRRIRRGHHTVKKRGTHNTDPLFGANPRMVTLIEKGLEHQKRLLEEKENYLQTVEDAYRSMGVALKLSGEHALGRNRDGFDTGVEWRLLDGGLAGNREEAKKMRIQESIAYDRDISEITHNYLEVAAYEMDAIENYIRHYYQKQKVRKWNKLQRLARHRMQSGMLTRWQYEGIHSEAKRAEEILAYVAQLEQKPFDQRYSDLIRQMDRIKLMPLAQLTEVALQRSAVLKTLDSQIQLLERPEAWYEQVSANLYLDRKQYTFVDRRETLAGMQLKVPLTTPTARNESRKLRARRLRLKEESLRQLLQQKIRRYYTDLFFHRNQIETYREEMAMARKSLEYLGQQRYAMLPGSLQMPKIARLKTEITLLDLEQKIWLERSKMLEDLIILQYLSGIDVL